MWEKQRRSSVHSAEQMHSNSAAVNQECLHHQYFHF